jgi:hypothetical protein
MQASLRNRAKLEVVDFFLKHSPSMVQQVPVRVGPGGREELERVPVARGDKLLEYRRGGKVAGVLVPGEIADFFERPATQLWAPLKMVQWGFRNLFYPFQIALNPFFLLVNAPARDVMQNWANGISGTKMAVSKGLYSMLLSAAVGRDNEMAGVVKRFIAGDHSDPIIKEMLAAKAILPTYLLYGNNSGLVSEDSIFAKLMAKYGMIADEGRKVRFFEDTVWPKLRGALGRLAEPRYLRWLDFQLGGQMAESGMKILTYQSLRKMGWSPEQAAYVARNNAGIPNTMRGGEGMKYFNALFAYGGVVAQATGSYAELLFGRSPLYGRGLAGMDRGLPGAAGKLASTGAAAGGTAGGKGAAGRTAGAFFGTLLKFAAGPLGVLTVAGALDEEVVRPDLYALIPDYEKTTKFIFPVGKRRGQDGLDYAIYLKLPKGDGVVNFIANSFRTLVHTKEGKNLAKEFLDNALGVAPTVSTPAELLVWHAQFLTQGNATDWHTGSDVVSRQAEAAEAQSVWPALKEMEIKVAKKWGWGRVLPKSDDPSIDGFKKSVDAVPVLRSLVGVTNKGIVEAQRAEQARIDAGRAVESLEFRDTSVERLNRQVNLIQGLAPELRRPDQLVLFEKLKIWRSAVQSPIRGAFKGMELAGQKGSQEWKEMQARYVELSDMMERVIYGGGAEGGG